jgi:hypothetical protein
MVQRYEKLYMHISNKFILVFTPADLMTTTLLSWQVDNQTYDSVDIPPSYQPDWALSALKYGLTPNCNLSQLRHERTSNARQTHAPTQLVTVILI